MKASRQELTSLTGKLGFLMTALTVAALAYPVLTMVARARPLSCIAALVVTVGSPYIPLVALTGVALAALSRRILLSIVAVVVLATTVAFQVPWYYFGRPANVGHHADLRMLSSNLRKGQANVSVFAELAEQSADVLAVSELTPEEVQRFSRAGIDEVFPYSVLRAATGAEGLGLWSRFPLTVVTTPGMTVARLRIPGVRFDPLVASVHITSPVASGSNTFDPWRSGIASTKSSLDDFAGTAGPAALIVAGDFNSTPDMRQFRDLLTNGYRDAVEQTGAGFAPTFPSSSWFPPVITIDHVLTRNAAAASVKTVTMPGSDHRSLLAVIEVPLDPTSS